MGFGSFFKKIGKVVGKVAASPIGQIGLGLIPGGGVVSAIARQAVGGLAQKYAGGGTPQVLPGGGALALPPSGLRLGPFKQFPPPGEMLDRFRGSALAGPFGDVRGGFSTTAGRRRRRMNAGNARAARRAIRRIKAVRNLLKGIERQLPKRHVCATRRIGFRRR